MSSNTKVLLASEIMKIDRAVTDGLNGVENSLSYRVHEIERHLHSYERWFEKATSVSGEVHVADRIGSGIGAFRLDAGDDDWGTWVQILGSADTPADVGNVYFDFHEVLIVAAERNLTYAIQFGFDASGADAITNGNYTEIMFQPISNQADNGPAVVQTRRIAVTTKAWARAFCPGQDTATIDFYPGLHQYEG